MIQHDVAIELVNSTSNTSDLNEATTRSRIIDTILYNILSWPKNSVTAEEHVAKVGFTDYTLKNQNNDNILIIEAKKEGIYFTLPKTQDANRTSSLIKIKTLLTDPNIETAINQVRGYCLETGTTYGAITNGHVWIFFTAFSPKWKDLNGFVIHDLRYFSENFIDAYNKFNYSDMVKIRHLENILGQKLNKSKLVYSIKNQISSFDVPVDLNAYAQFISKLVKYYFGDFEKADLDFLEHCYVDERLYENTKNTLKTLLIDNATPYLKHHGVIDYTRKNLSNKLSKKISNFITFNDNKHIVVIYGDRGCGKSTFINKLIYSDIPKEVHDKLEVVYINLLSYAAIEGDLISLKNRIWNSLITCIDVDRLCDDYSSIQSKLFSDEFIVFKKQLDSLYKQDSQVYGERIEQKIKEILNDYEKIAISLAKYLRETKQHEIVLIVDNTDQYSAEIQDFCFQVVSEIFSSIKCLSIITIREERFFRSKNLGVLDAYETTQYHISAPHADQVFIQRINYLMDSLDNKDFFQKLLDSHEISELPERTKRIISQEYFKKYFNVFKQDFKSKSNLYTFLVSCAQKDMRKALDLFRKLVVSGYMNIYDMVSTNGRPYILQIHQVLKPLMTPEKYFYDEKISSVPNIFRLRYSNDGSHFTAIRILKYLNK